MNKKIKEKKMKTLQKECDFWQKQIEVSKKSLIPGDFSKNMIESCEQRIKEIRKKMLDL